MTDRTHSFVLIAATAAVISMFGGDSSTPTHYAANAGAPTRPKQLAVDLPKLKDLEIAFLTVVAERDGEFLPYFRNYIRPDSDDSYQSSTLGLKLLGTADCVSGTRRIYRVDFHAEGTDADSRFGTGRSFLVFFDTDMQIREHCGIGCGELSLDGDVLVLGRHRFDLTTKIGFAKLYESGDWC